MVTVGAPNICVVATVPYSLAVFMAPHIQSMSRTYDVTLVANGGPDSMSGLLSQNVTFRPLDISRGISIVADVKALVVLWRLFRLNKFQIVHSITPKAGLLAMIAGRLADVPIRVHWFTGQVWATKRGMSRWLLKAMDRLLVACSTHVLADSPSQRAFLVREGIVRSGQVVVFGRGSVSGVDTKRFRPNPAARSRVRASVGIADNAVVALYLGRLNRDKGLPELAEAFALSARECPDLTLLVVGPDEVQMREFVIHALADMAGRVRFVDFTAEPEAYMAASDVFVLPSRREGFGSSVIEAAACEIPTIGTSIYGLSDALVDGESGILVPVGDVSALSAAIIRLGKNRDLRQEMGKAARACVERYFAQEHLTAALMRFYRDLLDSNGGSE